MSVFSHSTWILYHLLKELGNKRNSQSVAPLLFFVLPLVIWSGIISLREDRAVTQSQGGHGWPASTMPGFCSKTDQIKQNRITFSPPRAITYEVKKRKSRCLTFFSQVENVPIFLESWKFSSQKTIPPWVPGLQSEYAAFQVMI